jgi:hypothetical protein
MSVETLFSPVDGHREIPDLDSNVRLDIHDVTPLRGRREGCEDAHGVVQVAIFGALAKCFLTVPQDALNKYGAQLRNSLRID